MTFISNSHSLPLRPIVVASCISSTLAVAAAVAVTLVVSERTSSRIGDLAETQSQAIDRMDKRVNRFGEDAQRLEQSVARALDQLPVRLQVVDPSTNELAPVLRTTLAEADRKLGAIERTVLAIPSSGLSADDAESLCGAIRSLDRVALNPLGPDIRDRIEQLLWVADSLELLASDVGDPVSDIERTRSLAGDPRNCSGTITDQLVARIGNVRRDAEMQRARSAAASLIAECHSVRADPDPEVRVQMLESLAVRADDHLAQMSSFEPSATEHVHHASRTINQSLVSAREELRRATELAHARNAVKTIDARIAAIASVADPEMRVLQAQQLCMDLVAVTADSASLHDAAAAIVRGGVARGNAALTDADAALAAHRKVKYEQYVATANDMIGRFEAIFADADWKWNSWGIDEDKIVNAFIRNIAPIEPMGLPESLNERWHRAVDRAFAKVNASQLPALEQAMQARKTVVAQ